MELYTSPTSLEPMLPADPHGELADLAVELTRRAGRLSGKLTDAARQAIAVHLRLMNSYYSNSIEDHTTHPLEIERAQKKDLSAEPEKRLLQLEAVAHIEVHEALDARLANEPALDVCSEDFLKWIHREFMRRLPKEYLNKVKPGKLRDGEVKVGTHEAPAAESLPRFLARFGEAYRISALHGTSKLVAAAASHHRLVWIHPFEDGNGRVARLFTHAYLSRVGLDGGGLWTLSRGFARFRKRYFESLSSADSPRRGDLDGRGNLSDEGLRLFCKFVLETALDQVTYMESMLQPEALLERIRAYAQRQEDLQVLPKDSLKVLEDLAIRGEISRGRVAEVTSQSTRSSTALIDSLLKSGHLTTPSPKGALRIGIPVTAVGYYFPKLYPDGVEASM